MRGNLEINTCAEGFDKDFCEGQEREKTIHRMRNEENRKIGEMRVIS